MENLKSEFNLYSVDRFISVFITALVIVVPMAYSSKVTEIALYPKFLALTIITLILSIFWLIKVISQKRVPSFSTPLALPILFFLIINVVSLNAAINVYASLFPLAQLFTLIILFFILYNLLTRRVIYIVLKAWALVGAIAAVIGICQYLGLDFYWIPSSGNPSSTFAYRNMAAMYLILTIPVAGFLFFSSRSVNEWILWGFASTLMIVYLIYTRTRGAWVGIVSAIIISAIILLVLRKKRRDLFVELKKIFITPRSKWITFLVCFVVILFMSFLKPNIKEASTLSAQKSEVLTTATSILKGEGSGRLGVWQSSLDMFRDDLNWLSGVGLNNWHFLYPYYANGHMVSTKTVPFRPHNDFLWILTETGVVGFGIYIWLLFTAIYMVVQIMKHSLESKVVLQTLFLTTSILAILGHSLFSFPKERITISMLFWMILAIIAFTHRNMCEISPGVRSLPVHSGLKFFNHSNYRLGALVIIFFMILSVVSTEIARRHFFSDYHFRKALLLPITKVNLVFNELRKAEKYWFNDWRTAYYYGLAYFKLEKYPSAILQFKRCLKYSPYYLNTHYNLGLTYYKSMDYLNAIEQFLICINIAPKFAKAHYNLGLSWHTTGKLEEAEKHYRLSLDLDQHLTHPHNNLGVILMERHEYDKALNHFKKALEIDPDFQEALRNLDSTLVKMQAQKSPGRSGEVILP
ncbi:tetratricopeptide repeat protein [bacterium]|nr:tetratricopeptide repeat protein [bacterium]